MFSVRPSVLLNRCSQIQLPPLVVLPLVTILVLLTNAPDVWYLRTPLVVLSVIALVFETWRQAPQLWFALSAMLACTIYLNWESSDNHKYVMAYWCLVLCTTHTVGEEHRAQTLARSSRWLIGLCMFWATLWKAITPEYMSGTFFTYELLADERFARFTELWGQVPFSALADNRQLRDLMVHGYERGIELTTATFQSTNQVTYLAMFLTWWTVLIEGLLALQFLWPDSPRAAWWRNAVLLTFAVSTYSVATVRGFGWMLMVLGWAQCTERDRHWRLGYLAVLILIQIYTLPATSIWHHFDFLGH